MLTKRRIHFIYIALCLVYALIGIAVMIFRRQDFNRNDRCILHTILDKTLYFALPVMLFTTGSVIMFINCTIIIYKLTINGTEMRYFTKTANTNLNVKLTRAIIMTLTGYVLFYIPLVVITCVRIFIQDSKLYALEDVGLLFYFSNNLVNPFIYYVTLKSFKEGYKNLLLCRFWGRKQSINVAIIGCS